MQFIGRTSELRTLEAFYQAQTAGLLVLYGRRRIGKTRLITHFLEQQEALLTFYWVATTHHEAYQLKDFSQAILRHDPFFTTELASNFSFGSWEAALEHLAGMVERSAEPQLIVLDEFTYLLRNEPAISSVFQKVWDHRLSKIPQFKLVLTGSLIGMLARQVFSYQAPLYGRATAQIHLRALPFGALSSLFDDRSAAERVAIYALTGGVPAYLELFTRTDRFATALRDHCLVPGSMMMSDPAVILYEQLHEPQTYESVLSAIASGFHAWSDIAKMAHVTETALGHYLKTLIELELIEKRSPALAKPTNKRGRYYVRDPFLRFYYRFIVPQIGPIERGYRDAVVAKIQAELRAFIGAHVFEELCREWVWAAAMDGKLDFIPESVGSYWRTQKGKGVQLDVVAAAPRERRLLIGEAKWGEGNQSRHLLTDLIERSQRMPQVASGWNVQYVLFARDGFTQALHAEAKKQNALLIDLTQLEAQLMQSQNS